MSSVERNLSYYSHSHVLLQCSSTWYIDILKIKFTPEWFNNYEIHLNTKPSRLSLKYWKNEFADCTILGNFAYMSYLCLFIHLWFIYILGCFKIKHCFRFRCPHLDPGSFWSTESENMFSFFLKYAFENLLNKTNEVP